jgi:geranylgeranyl diphosphate synthase type II
VLFTTPNRIAAIAESSRPEIVLAHSRWDHYEYDMFDLESYFKAGRRLVETALDVALPPANTPPATIHKAMRYSVLSGGKRIRPIICLTTVEVLGGRTKDAVAPAVALELLHTYTLIHDDLPCMDDDDLRRGKPTCHVVFGEANAVLAGDALQALAFEVLATAKTPKTYCPNMFVEELACAAGSRGVVGGQVEDLAFENRKPTAKSIEFIHLHKTACLFRAAARMGAIAANATAGQLRALTEYGVNLGMAFQIADDLLDAPPVGAKTSKQKGKDDGMNCLSVYGRDGAKRKAEGHIRKAIAALKSIPRPGTEPLAAIARFVIERTQ